jgi:hypothetical protein
MNWTQSIKKWHADGLNIGQSANLAFRVSLGEVRLKRSNVRSIRIFTFPQLTRGTS